MTISDDKSSPCGDAGSETVSPRPSLDGYDAFHQKCQKNANGSILLSLEWKGQYDWKEEAEFKTSLYPFLNSALN